MKNLESLPKAYRITSTEYEANEPCVFLFINGHYYGDTIYPKLRKFPQSIEYWFTATCADSDRYFTVEEVMVDEWYIEQIECLMSIIEKDKCLLLPYYNTGVLEDDIRNNMRIDEINRPIIWKILQTERQMIDYIKGLQSV